MTHRLLILLMATAVLRAQADDPFSIVSMALDDEALARAHDVALSGDITFAPGKDQSLSVIDISDPAKPEIVWFKHDDEIPDSETVLPLGDHLLLGTKDFLSLDVKDPRNPVVLKVISDRPHIDRINGMIEVGDVVFAANKSGYIDAFGVSDLANPEYVGALETKKAFGLVAAYDITDPGHPQPLGSQSFPKYKKDALKNDNYHDLVYRDGYLYVSAQCDNGFLILKVDDQRIRELADSE
jgi:hypothetical protein